MSQNCFENEEVIRVGGNILAVLTDCVKNKNWSKCLADLRSLSCEDIDNIIRLYVAMSKAKKDGSYEKTRSEILEIFKTFRVMEIKNFVKKILEPLINSLDQINCLIDDVNKEFQLDSSESIDIRDLHKLKADLMSLSSSGYVRESYVRDTPPPKPSTDHTYMIVSIVVMAIMFLIILYLLMKQNKGGF
jgi:hypothetical protein